MADTSNTDVSRLIVNYGPRGRVLRLISLLERDPTLSEAAVTLLLKEAPKIIKDDMLYTRIYRVARNIDSSVVYDEQALDASKKATKEETIRLDEDVQRWRNLNKDENARIAYVELASHFENQGKFELAISKYLEAYEFANTHYQQIELRINICKAAVLGGSWVQVKQYAPHLLDSNEYSSTLSQFRYQKGILMVCLGLYYLHKRQYCDAARMLVGNPCTDVCDYFNDVLSEEHLGLYGALTAVVAYNRGQFEEKVIRNKVFNNYLQKSPKAMELVSAYFDSDYKAVNIALEDIKEYLKLDYYCRDQYRDFISAVRGKAMVQFFSPYSNMTMQNMCDAFGVSLEDMETELVTCISQGHINARINSKEKTVTAVEVDENANLFDFVKEHGEIWTRETKAMLLRMSMVRQGVMLSTHTRSRNDDEEENFFGGMLVGNIFNRGRRH